MVAKDRQLFKGRSLSCARRMPIILGIETSTEACSVALCGVGTTLEDHRQVPRQHNELVLGCIDGLLQAAGVAFSDIEAIAYGMGPGSFTGLRIAAGVTQGLALSRSLPVIGISTLRMLAASALEAAPDAPGAVAVLAARPREAYLGVYRRDPVAGSEGDQYVAAIQPDALVRVADSDPPGEIGDSWIAVGPAADLADLGFADLDQVGPIQPRARILLELATHELQRGRTVDAAQALPVYLQPELPWIKLDDRKLDDRKLDG